MELAPLVWINGFPGIGKLTIARALVEQMKRERVILIDNHQLIDPVEAKFPRSHPEYANERRKMREQVFHQYVENQDMLSRPVVFTGIQTTSPFERACS
jgi:adenylylsulfate kinase-like enzyme